MDRVLVLNEPVENVFCATGPGGGVDPTCSAGGRRVESGESFFHGTVQEALDSIREKGLVVGVGKGADEFAKQTGEFVDFQEAYGEIGGRKASVYISDDKYQAANYGLRAAKANKGATPIVLRIEIPSGQTIVEDEAGGSRKSFRFEGKIEPSWIKEVFTLDLDNDELVSQGPLVKNSEGYYLAFVVDPDRPTSNADRTFVVNDFSQEEPPEDGV